MATAYGDIADADEADWWEAEGFDSGTPSPVTCTGVSVVYDGQANPLAGGKIVCQLIDVGAGSDTAWLREPFTLVADANGIVTGTFRPQSLYQAMIDGGAWVQFSTPAAGSFELPGLVGQLSS